MTRTRLPIVALVCFALLVAASPASAQSDGLDSGGSFFFTASGVPAAAHVTNIELPVSISGTVSVEFSGTPAAGCERIGVCGLTGTTIWKPGAGGQLGVDKLIVHGQHLLTGMLIFGGLRDGSVSGTQVTRPRADGSTATCIDADTETFGVVPIGRRSLHSISVRLLSPVDELIGGDVLSSHCAGPLDSDLVQLLPVRPLRHSQIRHGGGTIDLSTTRPFASGGFSGVLRSTVVLHIGAAHVDKELEPRGHAVKHRRRTTEVDYSIERVDGSVTTGFSGVTNPDLCGGLDSCGASGTVTQTPAARRGSFALFADTPASRPRRDALTLLGAGRGGNVRGLDAFGGGSWRSSTGTAQETVLHSDDGSRCTDTVPLKSGSLSARIVGGRLRLAYAALGNDPLHTRCAGPLASDLPAGGRFASGSVPLSALRRSHVTVHLGAQRNAGFATPGYNGSIKSALTVTLRRTHVKSQVYVDEEFTDGF